LLVEGVEVPWTQYTVLGATFWMRHWKRDPLALRMVVEVVPTVQGEVPQAGVSAVEVWLHPPG
jgi:hypothetical protein